MQISLKGPALSTLVVLGTLCCCVVRLFDHCLFRLCCRLVSRLLWETCARQRRTIPCFEQRCFLTLCCIHVSLLLAVRSVRHGRPSSFFVICHLAVSDVIHYCISGWSVPIFARANCCATCDNKPIDPLSCVSERTPVCIEAPAGEQEKSAIDELLGLPEHQAPPVVAITVFRRACFSSILHYVLNQSTIHVYDARGAIGTFHTHQTKGRA